MGGVVKSAARSSLAVVTGGISEGINAASKGKLFNKAGISGGPMGTLTGMIGHSLGIGREGTPDMGAVVPGGQSNPDMLAQTGGAPVLSQIAMGVDPKTALAGFLGIHPDNWDNFVAGLSPKDAESLTATQGVLQKIQETSDVRQKAVQSVINDFPNVAAKIAQDRKASGQEFDEVTKGAMDLALSGAAAKYAAGGSLSSGAANEAFARVGAENGMNKLGYMGEREAASTRMNMADYGNRLAEVNALRDFQNTMMGQGASQGFSAAQANLGRIQQGGMANAQMQNQRQMQDSANRNASENALLGAVGSMGGSLIGGAMLNGQLAAMNGAGSAAAGASAGSSGYFNAAAPKTYTTSYGRTLGR